MGLTRAKLMNTALPTIEGLYAAYPKLFPIRGDGTDRPWSFCVIGPTRGELAALAPTVVRYLDECYSDTHPPGLLLSVHEGDSLRKVAEDFWEWDKESGYGPIFGLCVVLPEGMKADWPQEQQVYALA